MSTTFTDLLAPTKSNPSGAAFDWTREPDAKAGILTIKNKRIYTTYSVVEFDVTWDGRAFTLTKLTEGSDPTEEHYNCFLAKTGTHRMCECKGFTYTGGCKHILSLVSLIEAKQL